MDPLNRFGFRQKQKLDRAFEVFAFPIAKTFAAIIGLGQTELLESGSHRAVENDDAFAQKCGQGMEPVWHRGKETSFWLLFKEQIDAS
jgi:hypothetical protein